MNGLEIGNSPLWIEMLTFQLELEKDNDHMFGDPDMDACDGQWCSRTFTKLSCLKLADSIFFLSVVFSHFQLCDCKHLEFKENNKT